jgi:hypothetical protein
VWDKRSGIPTPKFDWESTNLPEQWRKFKSHVELIFDGPLKEKSEEVKFNYLLLWIGDNGREIRETWTDLDGSGSEHDGQEETSNVLRPISGTCSAEAQPNFRSI